MPLNIRELSALRYSHCVLFFSHYYFCGKEGSRNNEERDRARAQRRELRKDRLKIRNCANCISLSECDMKLIRTLGIEKAAEKCGYSPDLLVRSLKVKYAKN